jgi:hypothetical protein
MTPRNTCSKCARARILRGIRTRTRRQSASP